MRTNNAERKNNTVVPLIICLAVFMGVFLVWSLLCKGNGGWLKMPNADTWYLISIPLFSAFYGFFSYKITRNLLLSQVIYIFAFLFFDWTIYLLSKFGLCQNMNYVIRFGALYNYPICLFFSIVTKITIALVNKYKEKHSVDATEITPDLETPQPTE